MLVWLLWFIYFMSNLLYAGHHNTKHILDINQIQISSTMEHAYQLHRDKLCAAAQEYEAEHGKVPIVDMQYGLCEMQISELLERLRSKLRFICSADDVRDSFHKAYEKVLGESDCNERLKFWKAFAQTIHQKQLAVQNRRLAGMWFPESPGASDEKQFLEKNKNLEINALKKRAVELHMLLTYVPLAIIEHYDQKVFQVFLQVRDEDVTAT